MKEFKPSRASHDLHGQLLSDPRLKVKSRPATAIKGLRLGGKDYLSEMEGLCLM